MDELTKYKNKCKKYKKQIKKQKIIIEGLTMLVKKYEIQMKKEKDEMINYLKTNQIYNMSLSKLEFDGKESEQSYTANNSTLQINDDIKSKDNTTNEQNNTEGISTNEQRIIEDNIKQILNKTDKKEQGMKVNGTFAQFLKYCAEAKLLAKDVKNVSIYVRNNKKGILRQLYKQINTTKSYELFHIFWFLGHYLSANEKLIICHDLFLFVLDRYKIVPFIYALYKNIPTFSGKLGETIKHLTMQQLNMDRCVCGDKQVINFYNTISDSLLLNYTGIDLIEYATNLIATYDVFADKNINQSLLDAALSLKVTCAFLGWETTKKILIDQLIPKLNIHPCFAFYFGTVLTSFLSVIYEDESLLFYYKHLEILLSNENKTFGFVAYMFLKQIKLGKYNYWLEQNINFADTVGLNTKILTEYV